jgi:hypothetical protein
MTLSLAQQLEQRYRALREQSQGSTASAIYALRRAADVADALAVLAIQAGQPVLARLAQAGQAGGPGRNPCKPGRDVGHACGQASGRRRPLICSRGIRTTQCPPCSAHECRPSPCGP